MRAGFADSEAIPALFFRWCGDTGTQHFQKLFKELDEVIPIIAMTANAFREDVQKSLDAGENG